MCVPLQASLEIVDSLFPRLGQICLAQFHFFSLLILHSSLSLHFQLILSSPSLYCIRLVDDSVTQFASRVEIRDSNDPIATTVPITRRKDGRDEPQTTRGDITRTHVEGVAWNDALIRCSHTLDSRPRHSHHSPHSRRSRRE